MEIALTAIPTIAIIPFGKEITSTTLDENFIEEMKNISKEHEFWARTMSDAIDQHELNNDMDIVLKKMIDTVPASTSCDPARATTKGLRGMTFASTPFVDPSLLSRSNESFEAVQERLKAFFLSRFVLA